MVINKHQLFIIVYQTKTGGQIAVRNSSGYNLPVGNEKSVQIQSCRKFTKVSVFLLKLTTKLVIYNEKLLDKIKKLDKNHQSECQLEKMKGIGSSLDRLVI